MSSYSSKLSIEDPISFLIVAGIMHHEKLCYKHEKLGLLTLALKFGGFFLNSASNHAGLVALGTLAVSSTLSWIGFLESGPLPPSPLYLP